MSVRAAGERRVQMLANTRSTMLHQKGSHSRLPTAIWSRLSIDGTPNAGIGLATGSNCWVLDVDGDEGYSQIERREKEHGDLLPTPNSRTGGGGQLLFSLIQILASRAMKKLRGYRLLTFAASVAV